MRPPSPVRGSTGHTRLADFFIRLVKEKALGTACGIIILILILVAIFADVLAPYPYIEIHLADRLQGPSAQYLLGTDHVGRDFLSRLIYGARLSLGIGLAATTPNVVVAVLIGGPSGFFGGKLDLSVQRFVDAWIVFPGLLLLLTVMSIVGRGLIQIILVLGISGGIGASRVVRGAVMEQAPHLALFPGLALTITVYSLNMFGDAVRDLLDPRLRGGGGRLGADRGRSV